MLDASETRMKRRMKGHQFLGQSFEIGRREIRRGNQIRMPVAVS
jgi:hypothetical protein